MHSRLFYFFDYHTLAKYKVMFHYTPQNHFVFSWGIQGDSSTALGMTKVYLLSC